MTTKWYDYSQNNSGGELDQDDRVDLWVVVEANSWRQADQLAAIKAGIYFDGCDEGLDCPCCGDRWSSAEWSDAAEQPQCYGKPVPMTVGAKFSAASIYSECAVHLYHADGRHTKVSVVNEHVVSVKEIETLLADAGWQTLTWSDDHIIMDENRWWERDESVAHPRWLFSGRVGLDGARPALERDEDGSWRIIKVFKKTHAPGLPDGRHLVTWERGDGLPISEIDGPITASRAMKWAAGELLAFALQGIEELTKQARNAAHAQDSQ